MYSVVDKPYVPTDKDAWLIGRLQNVNVSAATFLGPFFLSIIFHNLLAGVNATLFGFYLPRFGGRGGDKWFIQAIALFCVTLNLVNAAMADLVYYRRNLVELFSPQGLDSLPIQTPALLTDILQAIPIACGQGFFAFRVARLYEKRQAQILLPFMATTIMAQLILMVAFGASLYTAGTWEVIKRDLRLESVIKKIVEAWSSLFVFNELIVTVALVARLSGLRRQCKTDETRKVMYALAVFQLQCLVIMATLALLTLALFRDMTVGWYTPVFLLIGPIYTVIILANLLHRDSVQRRMVMANQISPEEVYCSGSMRDRTRSGLGSSVEGRMSRATTGHKGEASEAGHSSSVLCHDHGRGSELGRASMSSQRSCKTRANNVDEEETTCSSHRNLTAVQTEVEQALDVQPILSPSQFSRKLLSEQAAVRPDNVSGQSSY